jgi:hypothetical protein
MTVPVGGMAITADVEDAAPWNGGGLNLFFDAQYAELSLGLYFGGGTREASAKVGGVFVAGPKDNIGVIGFNAGVLGKFPIAVGEKMRVFPLAGIDYAMALAGTIPEDVQGGVGDLSALWIKFGAGLDLDLSANWFFRPEFLYGFRLENKYEKDIVAMPNTKFEAISGKGVTVKIGLGMKI